MAQKQNIRAMPLAESNERLIDRPAPTKFPASEQGSRAGDIPVGKAENKMTQPDEAIRQFDVHTLIGIGVQTCGKAANVHDRQWRQLHKLHTDQPEGANG